MLDPLLRDHGANTVTIPNAGTTSDWVDYRSHALGAFKIPAAFTGTAVSIQVAEDAGGTPGTGGTLTDSDAGATVGPITVAANGIYTLPAALAGVHFFRFVSNAAEGGARAIVVMKKG